MEEGFVEVGARLTAPGLGDQARAKLAEVEAKLPAIEVTLAAELAKGFAARARELVERATRTVRPSIELSPSIAKGFGAKAQAEAERALALDKPTMSVLADLDEKSLRAQIAEARRAVRAQAPKVEIDTTVDNRKLNAEATRAIASASRRGALPPITVSFRVDQFELRDLALGAVRAVQSEVAAMPLQVGVDLDASKLSTAATEAVTAAQEAVRAQPIDVPFDVDPTVLIAQTTAAVELAEKALPTLNVRTTGVGGVRNPATREAAAGAGAGGIAGGLFGKGVLGGGIAGGALAAFFASSTDEASNLAESMSKVNVVFKDGAAQVVEWSKTSDTALGQSQQQALEAAGTYGNLFKAFGLSDAQATEFSITLTGLAADLASFNNTSVDDALLALRSGLSGETEPLKRFGVALSDARLKDEALRMGLIRTTSDALSPAAKAQASYALIMRDTTLAQGDFARTSEGMANQQRIVAAAFENLKASVGEAFASGLLEFLPQLIALVKDLTPELVLMSKTLATSLSGAARQLIPLVRPLLSLFTDLFDVFLQSLPAVIALIRALIPVVTGFLGGLRLMIPLLQFVVDLFVALPGPIQAVIAAMLVLNRVKIFESMRAILPWVTERLTVIGKVALGYVQAGFEKLGGVLSSVFPKMTQAVSGFLGAWGGPLGIAAVAGIALIAAALINVKKEAAAARLAGEQAARGFVDAINDTAKADFQLSDVFDQILGDKNSEIGKIFANEAFSAALAARGEKIHKYAVAFSKDSETALKAALRLSKTADRFRDLMDDAGSISGSDDTDALIRRLEAARAAQVNVLKDVEGPGSDIISKALRDNARRLIRQGQVEMEVIAFDAENNPIFQKVRDAQGKLVADQGLLAQAVGDTAKKYGISIDFATGKTTQYDAATAALAGTLDLSLDMTKEVTDQIDKLSGRTEEMFRTISGANTLPGLTKDLGGASVAILDIINRGGDLQAGLVEITQQLGLTGEDAAAFINRALEFGNAVVEKVTATQEAFRGLIPTVGGVFDELKSKADGANPSFNKLLDTLQQKVKDAASLADNIGKIIARGGTGILEIIQQLPADQQAQYVAQIASAGDKAFLELEAQARAIGEGQAGLNSQFGVLAVGQVQAATGTAVGTLQAQGAANLALLKAAADQVRAQLTADIANPDLSPGQRKLLREDRANVGPASIPTANAVTSQVAGVTDAINASLATVPVAAQKATDDATAGLSSLPGKVTAATVPGLTTWSGSVTGVTDQVSGAFASMTIHSVAAVQALAQGVAQPLDDVATSLLGFGLRLSATGLAPVSIWIDQLTGLVLVKFATAGQEWVTVLGASGLQAIGTWQSILDEMVLVTSTGGDRITDALVLAIDEGTPRLVAAAQQYATALADALNPVLAAVGQPTIGTKTQAEFPPRPQRRARGGQITGPNVDRDIVPVLAMPGEVFIQKPKVRQWGAHNLLELNDGRVPPGWRIPGFREGGQVAQVDPAGVARGRAYAEKAVGDPYRWGAVGPDAFDCSGLWSGIISAIRGQAPGRLFTSSSLIDQANRVGLLPGLGQISVAAFKGNPGHLAGTLAGTNYEATPPRVRKGPGARGADDPLFTDRFHMGSGLFLPNGQPITLPDVPDVGGVGELSRTAAAILKRARDAAQTFVTNNTYTAGTTLGDLFEPGGGLATSANVTGWATEAIRLTGVGMDWLPYLLTGIARESGGNPRAVNLSDSNARRGTPSKGILQVIDPTFAAHHLPGHGDIWNPVDNIAAAIRYILSRYGDIRNVQQFDRTKPPKGYAAGGLVTVEDLEAMRDKFDGFDFGGPPPPPAGAMTVENVDRIVEAIDRLENLGPTLNVGTPGATAPETYAAAVAHRLAPLLSRGK